MPRAPSKCNRRGCLDRASFRGYCDSHQPPRVAWQKNTPSRTFLYTKEWKLQRRRVLYRDNTFNDGCQLKIPTDPTDPRDAGCTWVATEVDHKLPVWYSGTERVSDEDLQGVCKRCHQKKSSFEGVQAKKIKNYLKEN